MGAGCLDSIAKRILKIIRDYHKKERGAEETQVTEAALQEKDRHRAQAKAFDVRDPQGHPAAGPRTATTW